jgi:geranylgeranyl diphosphate synthase, type I
MRATATLPPAALDLVGMREQVDSAIDRFLTAQAAGPVGHRMPELIGLLRGFLAGGKRIRPLLCVTGWYAAGGCGDSAPVTRIAASLELCHAFALVHDDVMDGSDTRRGRPAAHRAFVTAHAGHRTGVDARQFGVSGAILLGDLALAWSDELLHTACAHPDRLAAVLPYLHRMRTEMVYGQYLDLLATGRRSGDVAAAMTIVRYKTAGYTIERPLHIGATFAGADQKLLDAMTAYAVPLGEAFQLRDDLLGIFGRPRQTGKPTVDDLRQGKCTTLVALATRAATGDQAATLDALLGNPDLDDAGCATVRGILTATGATVEVEAMIRDRCRQALAVLDSAPFRPAATATLGDLARLATERIR